MGRSGAGALGVPSAWGTARSGRGDPQPPHAGPGSVNPPHHVHTKADSEGANDTERSRTVIVRSLITPSFGSPAGWPCVRRRRISDGPSA